MWTVRKKIVYILYTMLAKWLPVSRRMPAAKKLRCFFAKRILSRVGENVNIERGAEFTPNVEIGDNSGLGVESEIYGPVTIGKSVMMGPEVVIYTRNHKHEQGMPFCKQGYEDYASVTIGNNVWIGRRVMFMPGSSVGSNVVIGAGAVVTGNFGDNVIIGGVPAKVIRKM